MSRLVRASGFPGLVLTALLFLTACSTGLADKDRVLILIVDGLRPDYVTAEIMPRLNALAESGVRGRAHHAVIPTVTRVNGPSIFTGRYPTGHGLVGNSVYMPEVDPDRILDASDADDLRLIDEATGGELLTAPSLGELLDEQGLVLFAAASGSTGAGLLMNHRGAGAGLVHHFFTIPEALEGEVLSKLGPVPEADDPGPAIGLVARAVDAALMIGLDVNDADVFAVWLTEPDGTAHANGIGAPETLAVLGEVDAQIGRLLDGLTERGVRQRTDILVTSDHGFTTRTGSTSIAGLLVEAGLKDSNASTDVVVAGGAIHIQEGGPARVAEVVRVLQETDWIGPVLTPSQGGESGLGGLPGTLAFETIGWNHDRTAEIYTDYNWTDEENEFGYRGEVFSGGVAGHGSTSPWDIRATFIAAGPKIKSGVVSEVPTGNIDLTPTTLYLIGAPPPSMGFDGRVLHEVLLEGPDPADIEVGTEQIRTSVDLPDVQFELTIYRSSAGGVTYIDGTQADRTPR